MNEKSLYIDIDSLKVESRGGISAKTGKPWENHSQAGYLDTGKRFPVEVKVRLKDRERPHKPGRYEVDVPASIYVDVFGEIKLGSELVLIPAPAAAASKAA